MEESRTLYAFRVLCISFNNNKPKSLLQIRKNKKNQKNYQIDNFRFLLVLSYLAGYPKLIYSIWGQIKNCALNIVFE